MKFNLFTESTPPLVGVDISSTAVKMVELSDNGRGGYKLEGYSISALPKEAIVDGNIGDLEKVVDGVKLAWKLLGSREKRVALALPASAVISKKVLMSAGLREEDMEVQVEAEANQYIPFSLDEVNIDFQVIGAAPNNPDEVEVLIAAARKEKIEDRVAAAEGAGLKVTVMDVENYATEAAYSLVASQLPNSGREQTVMIVDIGASMMHVNVLHDNKSVYMRDQSFGGGQLTQEIQRRFGLSRVVCLKVMRAKYCNHLCKRLQLKWRAQCSFLRVQPNTIVLITYFWQAVAQQYLQLTCWYKSAPKCIRLLLIHSTA